MNNIFKVRAWDKKSHKMRKVCSIAFYSETELCTHAERGLPKVVNVQGYNIIEIKTLYFIEKLTRLNWRDSQDFTTRTELKRMRAIL